MGISVSYFGKKKPAAGVTPVWKKPAEKLPFNQANPVDWETGKHLLRFREEDQSGNSGAGEIGPVEDPGTDVIVLGPRSPSNATMPIEGTETASSDSWTANNAEGKGLDRLVVSRVVYNHAGDTVLYMMLRREVYDVNGRLFFCGPEVRVVVDQTDPELS